jgi:hypothetical protein
MQREPARDCEVRPRRPRGRMFGTSFSFNGSASSLSAAVWSSRVDLTRLLQSWLFLLPPLLVALAVLPFVDWGFRDNDVFTANYLIGRPYPPPIWPATGRFWPLGHQEWRLVPWMRDIHSYYIFVFVEFAIFCWAIARSLRLLGVHNSLAFLFITSLPPVVICFTNIVTPERNQLVLFSLWFLTYLNFVTGRSTAQALASLVFCNLALYFKEPTFLFFGALASVKILGTCGQNLSLDALLKKNWYEAFLLLSCGVYAGLFLWNVPIENISSGSTYAGYALHGSKLAPTALYYVTKEPLFYLLIIAVGLISLYTLSTKEYSWFRRGAVTWPLCFGALAYPLPIFLAGLPGKWYLALPLVALAIHFTVIIKTEIRFIRILLRVLITINVGLTAPAIVYQNDWIDRNRQLVKAIQKLGLEPRPKILIRGSGGSDWVSADAIWFAYYALHQTDAEFLASDFAPKCPICRTKSADEFVSIQLDLGHVQNQRYGAVLASGEKIFEYRSWWERAISSKLPMWAEGIVRVHYNVY